MQMLHFIMFMMTVCYLVKIIVYDVTYIYSICLSVCLLCFVIKFNKKTDSTGITATSAT